MGEGSRWGERRTSWKRKKREEEVEVYGGRRGQKRTQMKCVHKLKDLGHEGNRVSPWNVCNLTDEILEWNSAHSKLVMLTPSKAQLVPEINLFTKEYKLDLSGFVISLL